MRIQISQEELDKINFERTKNNRMAEDDETCLTHAWLHYGVVDGIDHILKECYHDIYFCEKDKKYIFCNDCKKCKIVNGENRTCQ